MPKVPPTRCTVTAHGGTPYDAGHVVESNALPDPHGTLGEGILCWHGVDSATADRIADAFACAGWYVETIPHSQERPRRS